MTDLLIEEMRNVYNELKPELDFRAWALQRFQNKYLENKVREYFINQDKLEKAVNND
jgi:hypothetical protein